jgi:hypothetical protein
VRERLAIVGRGGRPRVAAAASSSSSQRPQISVISEISLFYRQLCADSADQLFSFSVGRCMHAKSMHGLTHDMKRARSRRIVL